MSFGWSGGAQVFVGGLDSINSILATCSSVSEARFPVSAQYVNILYVPAACWGPRTEELTQKERFRRVAFKPKCHFSYTRLYKSAAESDAHEVAVILVLSHICMHRQSRGMSVVRAALHQHHREFLCMRSADELTEAG